MDLDTVAFWAHKLCAQSALVAVTYSIPGVEDLKTYLRFFEPRYKLYGKIPKHDCVQANYFQVIVSEKLKPLKQLRK